MVSAAVHQALLHALERVGVPVRSGTPRARGGGQVPDRVYEAAWEEAIRHGLRPVQVLGMAEQYVVGSVAPFDVAAFSQPTVARALAHIAVSWDDVGGPHEAVVLRSTPERLEVRWSGSRSSQVDRLDALFTVAVVFDRLRAHAWRPLRAPEVWLSVEVPRAEREAFRSFFGGEVHGGCQQDGFDLHRADGPVKLRTASPALAASVAKKNREDQRLVATILGTLPWGAALEDVARRLDVHPRTLQRRLARTGLRYRALVARVQEGEARRLLEGGGLSAAEVARAVGFSDASTFGRAFRRWTGRTPGAVSRSAARRRGGPGRRTGLRR